VIEKNTFGVIFKEVNIPYQLFESV